MRARRAAACVLPAAALLTALAVGCAPQDTASPTTSSPSSSATPSGYEQMLQKVNAAESAAASAEKDTAQDD
ncbi:hypothetical protein JS756_27710 [Streptomyces actuosus]|uniref:DUF305 domain-containing protein n=1 Tax=Streptomyces actuosus TaxID=1885 RepID=A0ABS2VXF6_STRAS|nr:hypothetical protein [Streptomyces actuosus]MBN0047829.1 hypothetical protein [Streptomyces actuosus]